MDKKQRTLAVNLLQTASDRLKTVSDDVPAFNLLTVLGLDRLETKIHSKIIFHLLKGGGRQDTPDPFLLLFLKILNIPQKFSCEAWNIYRERTFDSGAGRIDFVMESKSYLVMIEMKIDASDGDSQLMRYDTFGRKKRKEYMLYYLTPDGREPEEQSIHGVDTDRLRYVSFKKEIILWLQECMKCVDRDGYQYSFLKQYLGAVRHMTDTNDGVISVKDLLNNSEMIKAAQLVVHDFYEKMNDITEEFFRKSEAVIKRKTKLDTCLRTNSQGIISALHIYLNDFTYRKHSYRVRLFIDYDPCLETGLGFSEIIGGEEFYLTLDEAQKAFPSVYKKWMEKLESLDGTPDFKPYLYSKYFVLENSGGARLNFRDCTAQMELADGMNRECKYICGNIINLVIKPLLRD